jgi:adenylosuccinate lyase
MHTILLDASRDFWGYIALGYFRQKMKSNEVGSSTMPHKVNPIDFENAEGNFGLSNAIFQHFMEKLPISRWQRDLSDSTVLRNLGVALAHGILACQSFEKGLLKLEVNTSCIQYDLERHWVLLAEPIQTLMRKANIPMAYEQLKEMTRGQDVDQQSIHSFINQLPLDEGDKRALLALTPSDYSGYAVSLAKGYGT